MSLISSSLFPELSKYLNSNVKPGPNGCLEWDSCRSPEGYGIALEVIRLEYGTNLVSRLVYLCTYGFFPASGMVVRHTCGNTACCSPEHLREATRREVVKDSVERGLMPRGEQCATSKLTVTDVVNIRSSKSNQRSLAKHFGVSVLTIHNVRKRKTWKHVA